jgi:ABC-type antimicrobial peptide transport system permease subunit
VTPGDPLTWSLVLALIGVTTAVAAWGPAHAAARLDPLALLREE